MDKMLNRKFSRAWPRSISPRWMLAQCCRCIEPGIFWMRAKIQKRNLEPKGESFPCLLPSKPGFVGCHERIARGWGYIGVPESDLAQWQVCLELQLKWSNWRSHRKIESCSKCSTPTTLSREKRFTVATNTYCVTKSIKCRYISFTFNDCCCWHIGDSWDRSCCWQGTLRKQNWKINSCCSPALLPHAFPVLRISDTVLMIGYLPPPHLLTEC